MSNLVVFATYTQSVIRELDKVDFKHLIFGINVNKVREAMANGIAFGFQEKLKPEQSAKLIIDYLFETKKETIH